METINLKKEDNNLIIGSHENETIPNDLNQLGGYVLNSPTYEPTISLSTTTTTTTTRIREKILYQIFFADSNDQYYTWVTPIFDYDQVHLSGLIKKAKLSEDLIDTVVEVEYREEMDESNSYITRDLKNNGIGISVINHEELDWIDRTKEEAEKQFKEESLNAYRNILPSLINKVNNLSNQNNRQQQNRNRLTEL